MDKEQEKAAKARENALKARENALKGALTQIERQFGQGSIMKMGGICAFIDAEHAMDPAYAKRIGVDIDELLVSQPDHGEQALEIADLLIRSGAVDIVAIDSVAALVPKAEIEG